GPDGRVDESDGQEDDSNEPDKPARSYTRGQRKQPDRRDLGQGRELETPVEEALATCRSAGRRERNQTPAQQRAERTVNGEDEQDRVAARMRPEHEVVEGRETKEPDEDRVERD